MSDRLYCTLNELIDDIQLMGVTSWRESQAVDRIRAASDYIDRHIGQFIPVTATKYTDGEGGVHLFTEPLLAVTALTQDGTSVASTQYILYPRARHWENGPYTRLTVDPDASALSVWTDEFDVVAITGRWGLYESSEATGATVQNTTQIAAGGTSLIVNNGSLVCPCMTLLIGTEQLFVTATEAPTDSTANLTPNIDTSDESFAVSNGALVNTGEVIRIGFEQMKVLDKQTNTLLVSRGWNGTTRAAHSTNDDVYVYRTYTVKRGCNGTTDAAHANGTAISRYKPPSDVNALCKKLAALHYKIAETGYAGRAGSPETGETFYYEQFPHDIDRVMKNYRLVSF